MLFFRSHYMIFFSVHAFRLFFFCFINLSTYTWARDSHLCHICRGLRFSWALEAIELICSLWLRFCKLATNPIKWLIAFTVTSQWLSCQVLKPSLPHLLKVCAHRQQVLKGPVQTPHLDKPAPFCPHILRIVKDELFPSEQHLRTVDCKMIQYRICVMSSGAYSELSKKHDHSSPIHIQYHRKEWRSPCYQKITLSRENTTECLQSHLAGLWWSWTVCNSNEQESRII